MKRYSQTENQLRELIRLIFTRPETHFTDHSEFKTLLHVARMTNEIEGLRFYNTFNEEMPVTCVPKFIKGFEESFFSQRTDYYNGQSARPIHFNHRRFWTNDHFKHLYEITPTVENLKLVCEIVLDMIKDESGLAAVSGPISTGGKGNPDENLQVFNKAIFELSEKDLKLFNQMPLEGFFGIVHKLYLRFEKGYKGKAFIDNFYEPLLCSGKFEYLIQLPGWKTSVGSGFEYEIAKKMGIKIISYEEAMTMSVAA